MKKIIALLCAVLMLLALCACGQSAAPANEKVFTVGVCQLVQHPALDAATQGFVDTLKAKLGDKVEIVVQNGSGDSTTCNTICAQFVSDEVDLIMANATPALTAAQGVTADIPILGTSITTYGAAFGIDDWDSRSIALNVSGTSDLAPLDGQAEMLHDFFPDAKNVGILFCSGEPNSKYQVETITPLLEAFGYKVTVYAFADSNEVTQPTDNTAASCAEAINNVALPAGVPIIAGEEGLCAGCGVATLSISYYDIGCATAEMAYKILVEGADVSKMPIEYAPEFVKKYNADLCSALNIAVPEGYVAIEG